MPANTPIWKGPTNALVIQPNSPKLEYGDRVRATDIYKGPQNLCAQSMLPRGTYGTGFRTGWVVNKCSVETSAGRVGTLTVEWEAGGSNAIQPLPIGEYSLEPQEIYPTIERAGYFQGIDPCTVNICSVAVHTGCGAAGEILAPVNYIAQQIQAGKNGYTSITAPVQLALAAKLLDKLKIGEETFYLAAWRYTYTYFSYSVPTINRGGTPEIPGGPLAGNLPAGTSWLRLADRMEPAGVNGSMNKVTITYLGGPMFGGVGYWDPDIYA